MRRPGEMSGYALVTERLARPSLDHAYLPRLGIGTTRGATRQAEKPLDRRSRNRGRQEGAATAAVEDGIFDADGSAAFGFQEAVIHCGPVPCYKSTVTRFLSNAR